MDNELIINASSCLELLDIYQYSSSIKRFMDLHVENIPEGMFQQTKYHYEAMILESINNEGSNTSNLVKIVVSLGERFVIPSKNKDSDEVEVLTHFEADYIGLYKIINENSLKEKAIDEFARFNAVHNVWPFWREFVFRSADSMHLPKPAIPLMSGINLSNEEGEKSKNNL